MNEKTRRQMVEESTALNAEKEANWAGRFEGHIYLAIILTTITLSIGVWNAMVLFIFVSFFVTGFAYWLGSKSEGKVDTVH